MNKECAWYYTDDNFWAYCSIIKKTAKKIYCDNGKTHERKTFTLDREKFEAGEGVWSKARYAHFYNESAKNAIIEKKEKEKEEQKQQIKEFRKQRKEILKDFEFHFLPMEKPYTHEKLEEAYNKIQPQKIVMVFNTASTEYKKYEQIEKEYRDGYDYIDFYGGN